MKKEIIILALISTLFTGCAYAAPSVAEEDFEEMFGTIKEKVQPRPIDDKAANLAKEFAQKNNGPDPTLGRGGAVVYTFGTTMPRILCRPMRVVDIELEPGETVTAAPFIGDSVNWQVLPASSGSGASLTMHVMVKPSMPDLATNLIIHTSRRSYHLDLVSSNSHYTPHVKFSYPQQEISKDIWEAFLSGIETQKAAEKANQPYILPHEANAAEETPAPSRKASAYPQTHYISALDYNYRIVPKSKNVEWLPAAVYTDGAKTYIQFPQNLKNLEAPVFLAIRNGQRELVNYRLVGNTFVIDSVLNKGVLLAGSGAYSQKVIIVKEKKKISHKEPQPRTVPNSEREKPQVDEVLPHTNQSKIDPKPYSYEEFLKERRARVARRLKEAYMAAQTKTNVPPLPNDTVPQKDSAELK